MANVSLSLLVLKTKQLEKLLAFYASLGLDFVEEQHGKGPVHYAAQVKNVVLELYPLKEGPVDDSTRLGFAVDKLAELVEAVRAGGSLVVKNPEANTAGLRAVVRDPDGRAVELYQRE